MHESNAVPTETSQDPVFVEEQAHLCETHAKLARMARELALKMEQTAVEAASDKRSMAEELSPNFASYSDAMETYADFATLNRVIDAYNASQSIDAEHLANLRALLRQPYFAKVSLQLKPNTEPKDLYIGTVGASDENCRRMIVDWRSPVAEVYYNQDNGPTSYEANGRTIHVNLKLRRQFDIEENRLNAYFDTTVAIQDALLLASLSRQRSSQMQAITATIQREQNQVVRHDDVPALLVAGIAGSGKTSVLMQRIAYLFYQNRETLKPNEVFLVTPNPVFRRYVENVLPDLGERNPEIITWNELAASLLPQGAGDGKGSVPLDEFARVDEAMRTFSFADDDFKDVRSNGTRFFSNAQIRQICGKFHSAEAGPHLVTLVREELEQRLESRLSQMARTESAQDEVASLPLDEQLRLFGEVPDFDDEQEAAKFTLRYLQEKHEDAFAAVKRDEWLRIDRIGIRLLNEPSIHPLTWLYLKIAITGLGNANAKYVMIDEVQDYSAAQLAIMARYFKRASFLLLGDEHQAIAENTASFDEVRAVFRAARGNVSECQLMTSYRSTPQVTKLFASLLGEEERGHVSSVRREDDAPVIRECADEVEWERELVQVVEQAADESRTESAGENNVSTASGIAAVIAPWKSEAKRLAGVLGSRVTTIGKGDALPDSGVVLITLELAKGLEFDHVIVPDASERIFPDDGAQLPRNRLYTTLSRATKKVTMLAKGQVTSLLSNKR